MEGRSRTLRELREARGWSRLQLADQAGVTPQVIHQLEHGGVQDAFPAFRRVVDVLGVELDRVALGPHERLVTLRDHPVLLVARYRGTGCWVARPAWWEVGDVTALSALACEGDAVGASATEALTHLANRMTAAMDHAEGRTERSDAPKASPSSTGPAS